MSHLVELTESHRPPKSLEMLQYWFATIMTKPLIEKDKIAPISPSGKPIKEEACDYIAPSITLEPHERLEIYSQQYWWRLLSALHANFPLSTRLLGYRKFNRLIGVPFLKGCIPIHWSLNYLGDRLPHWISKNYKEKDRSLIQNAITLDWHFTECYMATALPRLDLNEVMKEDPEKILETPLHLQPHIRFVLYPYDLLSFRHILLQKEVEFWENNPLPPLKSERTKEYILFRNLNNLISWRELHEGECPFLKTFQNPSTIASVCDFFEKRQGRIYQSISKNLQTWLQDWVLIGLLSTSSEKES